MFCELALGCWGKICFNIKIGQRPRKHMQLDTLRLNSKHWTDPQNVGCLLLSIQLAATGDKSKESYLNSASPCHLRKNLIRHVFALGSVSGAESLFVKVC